MAIPKRKVIAKVPDGANLKGKIVIYHSRNIVTLFSFLKRKFGGCIWMNVYNQETGDQLPSYRYAYTEKNPPIDHI